MTFPQPENKNLPKQPKTTALHLCHSGEMQLPPAHTSQMLLTSSFNPILQVEPYPNIPHLSLMSKCQFLINFSITGKFRPTTKQTALHGIFLESERKNISHSRSLLFSIFPHFRCPNQIAKETLVFFHSKAKLLSKT